MGAGEVLAARRSPSLGLFRSSSLKLSCDATLSSDPTVLRTGVGFPPGGAAARRVGRWGWTLSRKYVLAGTMERRGLA